MSTDERHGAERMLAHIIREFANGGHILQAMAAYKIGERLLDRDPDGEVFPAAAAMPEPASGPTVRAKA
jgi:hypothetical protein